MYTLPKRGTNMYLTNEAIRLKNAKTMHGKDTYPLELIMTGSLTSDSKTNCRNLTRNLRSSFEMKMANDVKLKPKLFWKYARSRLKSRQAIPTLTNKDGTKAISA